MSLPEQSDNGYASPTMGSPIPFGGYLLDGLIAEGGMARVYRARLRGALGFEKSLVVKQVRPELASDPALVAMFAEEAKTLVRLGHPHIVPVYELGVVDGTYFIAMEHVSGVPLAQLMRAQQLPATWVAHIAVQTAEALHHAHERFQLVHRDVTPRNVLIDEEGHVRLVDFGIATPTGGGAGDRFGSVGYMSPEQLAGTELGPRSDIFSLGCVLYEGLTGDLPYVHKEDTLRPSDAFQKRADRFGPLLGSMLDDMLALEPSERPENAAAVARTMRRWLAAEAPDGVATELGTLTRSLRERLGADSHHAAPATTSGPQGTRRSTQALATSPLLQEVRSGTEENELSPGLDASPAHTWADESADGALEEEGGTVRILHRERKTAPQETTKQATEPGRTEASEDASAPASTPKSSDRQPGEVEGVQSNGRGVAVIVVALLIVAATTLLWLRPWEGPARSEDSLNDPSVGPATAGESTGPHETMGARTAENTGNDSPGAQGEPSQTTPMEVDPADSSNERPGPIEQAGQQMESPPNSAMNTAPPNTMDAAPRTGTVTISARPWAEVRIDGQTIGQTPLRSHRLRSGPHTIVLHNPALGQDVRRRINVPPGESVRVEANLNTDPPTLRVR